MFLPTLKCKLQEIRDLSIEFTVVCPLPNVFLNFLNLSKLLQALKFQDSPSLKIAPETYKNTQEIIG